MSYTASALALGPAGWVAADVDLAEVDDVDGLLEALADAVGAESGVLFLDEDDEYLLVARADRGDARLFVSDRRVLEEDGTLAGRIVGADLTLAERDEEEDDEESSRPDVEPAGDAGLLGDLGIDGPSLLRLCSEERLLPADVVFAICERLGCTDELEAVRGV